MWREATLWEVCEFMQYRKRWREIVESSHGGDQTATGIEFEDHTKVVCESVSWGPLSEHTPDFVTEPPRFFIFEKGSS